MRAPLSKLAKEILDDPDSARQLDNWLESRRETGDITLTDSTGKVKQVKATRLNTTVATHGFEPKKRSWSKKVSDFFNELLAVFVNPFGS
ncbi:hypothetical protein [Spirosoma sp. 209]|uniref:hypothetical protein n=1 Tax=Spirosoma sp. 209 TaxID=1955701 RepID=UPI00111786FC|nr:hypothetical protein [Spirosoma sp. 209]